MPEQDGGQQMNITRRYLWERFQGWWRSLKIWTRAVLALALISGIGWIFAAVLPPATAFVDAELFLSPSSGSAPNEIRIMIDNPHAATQPLYAVEVEAVFDPTVLALGSQNCAGPADTGCINGVDSAFPTLTDQTVTPDPVNPNRSVIRIVRGAAAPGVADSPAIVAGLRFNVIGGGTAAVSVTKTNSHVVTVLGGVAQDILFLARGGTYLAGSLTCEDPPPLGYGGQKCVSGGSKVCENDPSKTCSSSFGCPIPGAKCKTGTGIRTCENNINISCFDDFDCQEYAACLPAAGTTICPGTELPDSDTTTVCCSVACTPFLPGQLYIQNVAVTILSASATTGSARIDWSTSPATPAASVCDISVDSVALPQTTGNPVGHSAPYTGPVGTHTFEIRCTLPGYAAAVYSGPQATFTISPSTANLLTIDDVVIDPTYQTARVGYGTSKTAQGAVEWVLGACSSANFAGAPIIKDAQPVRTHQASLTGLAPNSLYCTRISAGVLGASPPETAVTLREFTTLDRPPLLPDANVLMRVERDRVCRQWLYCQSSVRLRNQQNRERYDDFCFDVGVCDTLDPSGVCANPVSLESSLAASSPLTFQTPEEVWRIKDVSGYAKAGLQWDAETVIPGLYPYVRMEETGRVVRVQNANFESGQLSPWRAHEGALLYNIRNPSDRVNASYALKVVPGARPFSGARVPVGIVYSAQEPLRLTFRARTDETTSGHCSATTSRACDAESPNSCPKGETCIATGKAIRAQLAALSGATTAYYNFIIEASGGNSSLRPGSAWRTYQARLGSRPQDGAPPLPDNFSGTIALQFVQEASGSLSPDAFYIDDVSLQPVLEVSNDRRLPRACRLYPRPDAPACDFLEFATGKEFRGWKGYCVERQDPDDEGSDCLIWWPVDVLAGSADIFSGEGLAGYTGRKPLYYCLESKGDWPYYRREISGKVDSGSVSSKLYQYDISRFGIHGDELIEVIVDNIEIDDDDDGDDMCEIATEAPLPTTASGQYGRIVLNQSNKEAWTNQFTTKLTCDGGTTTVNNAAFVRCSKKGRSNDCNTLSARLEIDNQGVVQEIQVWYNDGRPSGRVKFSNILITYRGERCDVLAQVVTPEGDSVPWTSRVSPGGWGTAQGNALQYPYGQDFAPYGGLVPPSGASVDPGEPETWPGPAYVEAPLTQLGGRPPYQYRAGSPYGVSGVFGLCSIYPRVCSFNDPNACSSPPGNICVSGTGFVPLSTCSATGELCDLTASPDPCTLSAGVCLPVAKTEGGRVCLTGSADRLGKSCEGDANCGFAGDAGSAPGICAGLDKPGKRLDGGAFGWGDYYTALRGGAVKGKERLQQLFARAYGVWAYDAGSRRYRACRYPAPAVDPNPPGCVEPWDLPASIPAETQPRVLQIVADGPPVIKRAGGVVLKFTASVNGDHKPLTAYRVDWGDGSAATEVAGLRIDAKANIGDPHIALHTYQCGKNGEQAGPAGPRLLRPCSGAGDVNCWDPAAGECHFQPGVQVTDNWGLCNGGQGIACAAPYAPGSPVWEAYGGVIRVKP